MINRFPAIDYLRAFVTVLVVAHHAALAYTSFSVFNPQVYILSTHPVVDVQRAPLLDVLVSFNDGYFMALMFLISGLFVGKALQQKSRRVLLRDRTRRLLLPFVIGVCVLMPLAYYPAWRLSGKPGGVWAYLVDFFTVEGWPVGPPWFIWVLFLWNVILVICKRPSLWVFNFIASRLPHWQQRPYAIAGIFFLYTVLLYVPTLLCFGPYTWTGIGPLDFQESRLLLYFGYFLLGGAVGMQALREGLLARDGGVVKKWPLWVLGSVVFYGLRINDLHTSMPVINGLWFAAGCTCSCLALLALFVRFMDGDRPVGDMFAANAYGIYLLHYVPVVWLQYGLLAFPGPAMAKFFIVFISTLAISAYTTAMLRKIPALQRYL